MLINYINNFWPLRIIGFYNNNNDAGLLIRNTYNNNIHLWNETSQIIKEQRKRNIIKLAVTSDMGGAKVGMWKTARLDMNNVPV